MAIRNVRNPEWRDEQDASKFPFEHTATLRNDAGDLLFEGTFLDASFYPVGGKVRMYLSKVVVGTDNVTLYIGDAETDERCSSTFSKSEAPDVIRFVDKYGRSAGVVVSQAARLAIFGAWALGVHKFTVDQTALVSRCCIPTPQVGFRGFELASGELITDDIWLVGGEGVVLTCEKTSLPGACGELPTETDVVRVDIVGDPLFRRRLCTAPGLFETPKFIQTISFCTPPISGTPGVPPVAGASDADILLLCDTTASMNERIRFPDGSLANAGAISTIRSIFAPLASAVAASLPGATLRWGVANYRDVGDVGAYYQQDRGFQLNLPLSTDTAAVSGAIDEWLAEGGGDWEEEQFIAFTNIVKLWALTIGGTANKSTKRIIVWTGDSPGHTGGYYSTLAQVIADLKAAEIVVIPANVFGVGAGIDTGGQASSIATATGGVVINNILAQGTVALQTAIKNALLSIISPGTEGTPETPGFCYKCGPGDYGDVKISVGSSLAKDTILRVRTVAEGLVIEAVGERLESLR